MKRFYLLTLFAAFAMGSAASAAGLQNGSFEMGSAPGGFTQLNNGSMAITGWTVGGDSIDYIGSYWNASNGERSVDLSGGNAGSVSQTFDTIVGQQYRVNFDLAGNPAGAPAVKTVIVSAGMNSASYTFDASNTTPSNMGWQSHSFLFTASNAMSTLEFRSDNHTAFGPALDNVSVQAVPEPASLATIAVGGLGLIRRRRK